MHQDEVLSIPNAKLILYQFKDLCFILVNPAVVFPSLSQYFYIK